MTRHALRIATALLASSAELDDSLGAQIVDGCEERQHGAFERSAGGGRRQPQVTQPVRHAQSHQHSRITNLFSLCSTCTLCEGVTICYLSLTTWLECAGAVVPRNRASMEHPVRGLSSSRNSSSEDLTQLGPPP